jgi:hypothetical protein
LCEGTDAEKMCVEVLCPPKRKHVEKVYRRYLDQLSSVTSETCSDNKGNLPRWAKSKPEKNRRGTKAKETSKRDQDQ